MIDGTDLRELTDIVVRLTEVLDLETAYLDEGRLTEMEGLQQEKSLLAAAVNQAGPIADRLPEVIDYLEDDELDDLTDLCNAVADLRDAAATNERALRAAIRATDRVIRTVVFATKDVGDQNANLYTRHGLTGQALPGAGAVDKVL